MGENEQTSFFDIVAWGRQAETIAQYFSKGQRIGVVGKLKQDRYEAKDGTGMRSRVSIVLRDFVFIEPKGYVPSGTGGSSSMHTEARSSAPPAGGNEAPPSPEDDDEVPF